VLAALAWKYRYWGVAGRVHYTLVALAAVVFVLFLSNWNLTGLWPLRRVAHRLG